MHDLADAGVIEFPDELRGSTFNNYGDIVKSDRHYTKWLEDVCLSDDFSDAWIELIYLVPYRPDDKTFDENVACIDFEFFSRFLETKEDLLSRRFAESLKRWQGRAGYDLTVL